jgi:3'-phosphoadenosine 5'-phosphosulfate sulfotransferase (PAPS reductase)/FAD synthetase
VRWGRFPGGGSRHCTDTLKINQTRLFCKHLAQIQGGFEVWYGMRLNESPERAERYAGKVGDDLYEPHEVMPRKYPQYLGKLGVRFRLPILEWSKRDVLDYLDGEEHPHYALGFDRVGCFPCLAGGDKAKERAFNHDEFGQRQFVQVSFVSAKIGKSIWTSKGGKSRNEQSGCAVCQI